MVNWLLVQLLKRPGEAGGFSKRIVHSHCLVNPVIVFLKNVEIVPMPHTASYEVPIMCLLDQLCITSLNSRLLKVTSPGLGPI